MKSYWHATRQPGSSQIPTPPAEFDKTRQFHYTVKDVLYRPCESLAKKSDSASTLELHTYKYFRETYMLDIDEYDAFDIYD